MLNVGDGEEEIRNKNTIVPESQPTERERQPMQIFGKSFPTYTYTNFLVKYPTVLCALFAVIPLLLTILSISVNVSVERGLNDFRIEDHAVVRAENALKKAQDEWYAMYTTNQVNSKLAQRTSAAQSQQAVRLYVQYKLNSDRLKSIVGTNQPDQYVAAYANLLNANNIPYYRGFERAIYDLNDWYRLCWRASFRAEDTNDDTNVIFPSCTPLNSILTYFYIGSYNNASKIWEFSGVVGDQQRPHEKILDRLFMNPRYSWFMDQAARPDYRFTTLLRTQITLGWPPSTSNAKDSTTFDDDVDEFISAMMDLVDRYQKHEYIDIGFGGDRVAEVLVLKALRRDSPFVTLSLLFVFVVLWYHFHSFILALLGLLQVAMTYPAGLFLYATCSGAEKLSLLSALSVYVAMLFELDAMMIWFDTFKHSGFMSTTGRMNTLTVAQRTAYTFRKAGVGISLSALVVFISFMVNLTSDIPAIRGFSGLMATLVALHWFMMMTLFPSSVLFHHFHISGRRRNLQRQKDILIARGDRSRFPPQVRFHEQMNALREEFGQVTYRKTKAYMDAELKNEVKERNKQRGFFDRLGVDNPIRLPNPFKKHKQQESEFVEQEMTSKSQFDEPSVQEQAEFMDQFADAGTDARGKLKLAPSSGTFGQSDQAGSGAANIHTLETANALFIANYNCDEMLAFDDTRVRHMMVESGNRTAAEFSFQQLHAVAPEMGIRPIGDRALTRVANACRMGIYLLFGVARTLQLVPDAERRRAAREAAVGGAEGGAAAAVAAGAASGEQEDGGARQTPAGDEEDADAHKPAAPPAASAQPSKHGFLGRISNWYSERKKVTRRCCCGLVGQRLYETEAEREERIMKKKVKHEGYSRIERFFFNRWAPALNYARFPLCILGIIIFATSIALAGFLEYSVKTPRLLGDDTVDQFDATQEKYGEEGSCDYCSAYFRPRTDFPEVNYNAVLQCARETGQTMMHSVIDRCGVCEHNEVLYGDKCFACDGIPNGDAVLDDCNQCLLPSDSRFNKCDRCRYNTKNDPNCTYCAKVANAPLYYNGNQCERYCSPTNCRPEHGVCNPVTGLCDCHEDRVNGFWRNDPNGNSTLPDTLASFCTVCSDGFFGQSCTFECFDVEANGVPLPAIPFTQCTQCNNASQVCESCARNLQGGNCTVPRPEVCDHGSYSQGVCVCDTGYGGPSCQYSRACYLRGVLRPAVTVNAYYSTRCDCIGNYVGPTCLYCACFNGGTCDSDGKCQCPPGFEGDDCSRCPQTCADHGSCAYAWTPSQYSVQTCRALYCSEDEWMNGAEASESCRRCGTTNHTAYLSPDPSNCSTKALGDCFGACMIDPLLNRCTTNASDPIADNQINCKCNGQWMGDKCETCNVPAPYNTGRSGVTCSVPDGEIIGCNRLPAVNGVLTINDNCGTCGGSGRCVGCDGIAGSTKVIDSCGICGGFNDCLAVGGNSRVRARINVIFGVKEDGSRDTGFDFNNEQQQWLMYSICDQLARQGIVYDGGDSSCVVRAFAVWVVQTGYSPTFPVPRLNGFGNGVILMDRFVRERGRFQDVGFNSNSPTSPDFDITFIRLGFLSTNVFSDSTVTELQRGYNYWSSFLRNVNDYGKTQSTATALMASDAWVRLKTHESARKGTISSTTIGAIVFLALTLTFTCSATMSILSTMLLVSCILCVLGMFFLVGWEIGAIEQVAMTFLLGVASEQILQNTEGYLEYLHATQSHLFARDTTTLQAVKGMLQRTGVSVTLSTITIIICSSLLYAAEILVFRRIASIMIIIVCVCIFHSMLIFGAVLCVFGPITSFRNRRTMLVFFAVGCVLTGIAVAILVPTKIIIVE